MTKKSSTESDGDLPLKESKSILDQLKDDSTEVLQLLHSASRPVLRKDARFSQTEFMNRLETFDKFQAHWIMLSMHVSPIQFALYGWRVQSRGYVRCDICHAMLSVKYSMNDPGDSLKHVAKYLRERLRSGHTPKCLWSTHIDNHLPEENFKVKEILPSIKTVLQTHTDITVAPSEAVFDASIKEYLETSLLENTDSPAAVLIALHAWKPLDNMSGFKCRLCAVTIKLSPYNMPLPFEPVKFHQAYCPVRLNTRNFQERVFLNNVDDLQTKQNVLKSLQSLELLIDSTRNVNDVANGLVIASMEKPSTKP